MTEGAQYEVFIESVSGSSDRDAPLTNWSWRRLDAGGQVLVRGNLHHSLEACFASVKRHIVQFGQAPVKVNLQESCRR